VTLIASLAVHLALIVSEWVIPHMVADAKLAAHQMIYGRYRTFFWTGMLLGAALPLLLSLFIGNTPVGVIASVLALVGLLAYEHAFVQAGQSVPLS